MNTLNATWGPFVIAATILGGCSSAPPPGPQAPGAAQFETAAAQSSRGIISGVIVYQDGGQPVAQAQVRTVPETDIATTQADGQFVLMRMPNGTAIPSASYKLVVTLDGFQLAKPVSFAYTAGSSMNIGSVPLRTEKKLEWRTIKDKNGREKRVRVISEDPLQGK